MESWIAPMPPGAYGERTVVSINSHANVMCQRKTVRKRHGLAFYRIQCRIRQNMGKSEADLEPTGQSNNPLSIGMDADHRVAINRLRAQSCPPFDDLGALQHRRKPACAKKQIVQQH